MAAAPGDSAVSENMESWHTCIMDPRKQNCSRARRSEPCQSGASGALGGPWPSPDGAVCVLPSQAMGTVRTLVVAAQVTCVDQLSAMIAFVAEK